jgi:PhzF family phenazine biosynthesis protein
MKLPIYVIDAFTQAPFKGNYAAVVPLQQWIDTSLMQAIATENNLSETAFFVQNSQNEYEIRWFSPIKEIEFCGHATLASAYVVFRHTAASRTIVFTADSVGDLPIEKLDDGSIEMSFPNRCPTKVEHIPVALTSGLSIPPVEVWRNQQAYIVVYPDEKQVKEVVPDLTVIRELGPLDVCVTAPGKEHDFVSRYFWPANGGDEDPVTGSIHAGLAPLWASRLGRHNLLALQASRRTGLLRCRVAGHRVYISGSAIQYLAGEIEV